MSPEQARGEAADARADLFAVGVVLYEMATGKKPFEGESWVATVEAVMNRAQRPARELNRDLEPEIGRVIERALEKDPAARYQTAADLRAELVRIKRRLEVQRAPPSLPGRHSVPRYVVAAVPIVLAVAGLTWYLRSPKGPVTSPSEYVQLTNFSDYATAPALSPDGRMVAFFRGGSIFLGTGQIYVKLLPDGESKVLTDDPNPKYDPVFTPDGSRVAYTIQNPASRTWDTLTVPVLGGSPTRLMQNAAGLSWFGPDHRIVFSEVMSGTALHMGIVTSRESRAEEREIYFPNHERAMAHYSWPSPDLRSILIVEMDRAASFQRCRVVPMDGGSMGTQVGPQGACIASAWSPDGRWMYFNMEVDGSTHLWRQRVPDGIPEQITFGPTEEEGLAMAPDGKWLVSSVGVRQSSVWTHDASGDHAVSVEGSVYFPRLSADGKRLYYLLHKGNSSNVSELWSRELISGKSDPIVTSLRVVDYDILEDQAQVAFTVRSQGTSQIYLAALDRSSPPRLVTKDGDTVNFGGNGVLLFRQLGDKANYLARIRTDGNGLERITDTPIANKDTISPDGVWVTVAGSIGPGVPTGTNVISLRDDSRRNVCSQLCSIGWSRDGKFLYVTTNRSLFNSTGRTIVVPMPRGFGQVPLPAAGFDRASDEELAGLWVIRRGDMSPGPDPDTYTFTTAAFQGNLFRIPLH